MSSTPMLRLAARPASVSRWFRPSVCRAASRAPIVTRTPQWTASSAPFSTTSIRASGAHEEETFEEFSSRYEKEFEAVQDVFELQRNLNNAFAYDLVPAPTVIVAALKAARRVNDYPTAVRIFEGIKEKVENTNQYNEYLAELEPLRKELGVSLKEDLYPEGTDSPYYNP